MVCNKTLANNDSAKWKIMHAPCTFDGLTFAGILHAKLVAPQCDTEEARSGGTPRKNPIFSPRHTPLSCSPVHVFFQLQKKGFRALFYLLSIYLTSTFTVHVAGDVARSGG